MQIAVQYDWAPQGIVRLDEAGKPVFPSLPEGSGLYRLRFISTLTEWSYIGEANDLRKRMNGYRNPGPTQETNRRINPVICEEIRRGNRVIVETATDIRLEVNGHEQMPNLASVKVRRFIENAALVAAEINGENIHNL